MPRIQLAPPSSFFIGPRIRWRQRLGPEAQGYRDGLRNRHYCPHLNYTRGEDWIAWYQGWLRGREEFKRRMARRGAETGADGVGHQRCKSVEGEVEFMTDSNNPIPPRRAALYALARQIHDQAQMDAHQRRVYRAAQKLRALRDELWEKHGEIVLAEAVREVFHKWM